MTLPSFPGHVPVARRRASMAAAGPQRRRRPRGRPAEICAQRARIGQLLGQLRDTEHGPTQEAIQRITTENTTLKQRVRQLTTGNRVLEERLQAARSNNRFLDKRIAGLEAQLLDAATS